MAHASVWHTSYSYHGLRMLTDEEAVKGRSDASYVSEPCRQALLKH